MATDKPSSPFNRTAQHDAKRAAILSQSAKLFNYKGSRATTLRDIAETLGLTKTSLYYYVKTKEELIYQCYMAALEHHHSNLDDIEQRLDDPLERASAFFLQHFENWLAAQEGRGPHIASLLEIAALKGDQRQEVESRYIDMFRRLRQYLRDGMAQGKVRQCHSTSATRAILGSVDWAFSWLHQIPRDQVEDTARVALDILTHGLYGKEGIYHPVITDPVEDDDDSLWASTGRNKTASSRRHFPKPEPGFSTSRGSTARRLMKLPSTSMYPRALSTITSRTRKICCSIVITAHWTLPGKSTLKPCNPRAVGWKKSTAHAVKYSWCKTRIPGR